MEELFKALNPWPQAQGIVIGLAIAGVAFWAVRRGLQDGRKRDAAVVPVQPVKLEHTDEEKRLHWIAHEQLENIEKNSFKMVDLLKTIAEAVNRFNDTRWNKRQ